MWGWLATKKAPFFRSRYLDMAKRTTDRHYISGKGQQLKRQFVCFRVAAITDSVRHYLGIRLSIEHLHGKPYDIHSMTHFLDS